MHRVRYDVAIVGAGSAGAILAARLSEDPTRTVLLIDAGPDYPTLDSLPHDLKYGHASVGQHRRADQFLDSGDGSGSASSHIRYLVGRASAHFSEMPVQTARVVGGGSAINGAVFVRGMPEDYDKWSAAGNLGWSFTDLLPYFRKIETDLDFQDEFHGADGPITVQRDAPATWLLPQVTFREACLEAGFAACPDLNHPRASGIGPIPFNTIRGMRASTAITYLAAARARPNLTIQANCMARRLVVSGAHARGMEIEQAGRTALVEADEIILSAGAIGSPHLLLLSGIGPQDPLEAANIDCLLHLPGVGQNLRDHPSIELRWTSEWSGAVPATPLHPHQLTLLYSTGVSSVRDDMRMRMQSFFASSAVTVPGTLVQTGLGVRATLQLPVGRGELRAASADPHAPPLLDYRFLEEELDRGRLRAAARLAIDLIGSRHLGPIARARLSPVDDDLRSDAALDDWLLHRVQTAFHICGTCKMGPDSDPLSVVDSTGRVYGLENLRVVDASIMPDVVRANINATTMAIAERLAHRICHDT
jgi:choline dehydrogenase